MTTIYRIVSIYLLLIGLSAVYGGWAIYFTDTMHFPPDILSTTPFTSFLIPAMLLAFVVGGSHLIAAYLLWNKHAYRYYATAVAGFGLLIWMCTEIFMIPSHHFVQIVYLGFAMTTLLILMAFLKYYPE